MGTNEINDNAKEHICCINERTIKMKDWLKILLNLLLFFACGMINYYMFKSDNAFLGGFIGAVAMDYLLFKYKQK